MTLRMSEIAAPREAPRPIASASIARFLGAIQQNPRQSFYLSCAIHLVLWTVAPTIFCRDLPIDPLEGLAYGQEFQLGYWKHPPLPWWILGAVHRIAGPHLWAYFLLGQATAIACVWMIWRLGRELLTPLEAFVAVVLLDGYLELNFNSKEFNHGLIELPLFGAIGWFLYRAFMHGRRRDWILAGLFFALAFYGKYSAVLLLVPLLLFAALEPRARRCWQTPGPYLAMLAFAVLMAPHLLWLTANEFRPIWFFEHASEPVPGVIGLLGAVALFIVRSLTLIAGTFAMFIALAGSGDRRLMPTDPAERFSRRYIATLTLGPLCLILVANLVSGRSFPMHWSNEFWCFTSLCLMLFWRPVLDQAALLRLGIGWATVTAVLIGAAAATDVFWVGQSGFGRTQFPGAQFAAAVADIWRRETGQPLGYLAGDYWLVGNVIMYSHDRPIFYIRPTESFTPWIDEADVVSRGAMLLWSSKVGENKIPEAPMPDAFRAKFPTAKIGDPLTIREHTRSGERIWRIGWALLLPKNGAEPSNDDRRR